MRLRPMLALCLLAFFIRIVNSYVNYIHIPSNQHTDCETNRKKIDSVNKPTIFSSYLSAKEIYSREKNQQQHRKTLIDYHCCFCFGFRIFFSFCFPCVFSTILVSVVVIHSVVYYKKLRTSQYIWASFYLFFLLCYLHYYMLLTFIVTPCLFSKRQTMIIQFSRETKHESERKKNTPRKKS